MAHSIPADDVDNWQSPSSSALVVVSAWFGATVILLTAVGYTLGSPTGPSPAKPVVDLLQFGLAALILASLAFMVLRAEEGLRVTAVPLFINIGTLIIIQLVPFGVLWEEIRFQTHFYQYQAIRQHVESGEWQPDGQGFVRLPAMYAHLSADDGRLWVEQSGGTAVFFVTEQRGLRQFTGYYRHSQGWPPQSGEFQGQWRAIVPKRGGWYFCISN